MSGLSFARPHLLWLLLVVPPGLVLFFWWSARTRRKLAAQFIQARLLPGLVAGVSSRRRKLRATCLVAAVTCLVLALAEPQWGYDLEQVTQRGLDIVVAVDTSKSMLAEDIAPNRLQRAKLAVLDLMQQAKSDRLGLVAFAGSAFLQCPLTVDDSAFRQSVAALNVNIIPQGGTALAQAINTALQAFKEGDNYKVLVLFTDGEDHDSGALAAAKKAAAAGLRIFTIGIGSAEGELLRVQGPNGRSDYVRDAEGNVVKSHLNAELLQQVAGAAHGFYLPLQGADTMDVLYQRGLAPLPKSDSKERWVKQAHARYHWPLALAIVLLVAEVFLPERKRETKKAESTITRRAAAARVGLTLVACLALPKAVLGSPSSALREYKSGNYKSSLNDYEELLQKRADDPRLHFNAGAAAYQDHQFSEAARHFDQAVLSPDLKLQEQAYYNLGNTLFRLGEQNRDPSKKSNAWEQSLTNYSNSLQLNPGDADAKFNYQYVKKKLEELKKQQQQQQRNNQNQKQKQSQNQNQKPNQNQNQQQQQNKENQQSQQDQQRQQNSQQQQPDNQREQEQKQPESPQQTEQQKKQEQAKQQQAQKSSGDKKDQSQPDRNQQSNRAYAAGEMTPQQARQLLDAQKGDEMMLPVKPEGKAPPHRGPIMDW